MRGIAGTEPPHGTRGRYINFACRCAPCRRVTKEYMVRFYRGERTTVDATGSRRRLQALALQGWNADYLAERTGIVMSTLKKVRCGAHKRLHQDKAKAITRVFDEIGDATGPSDVAVGKAAKMGYLPSRVWLDIDDPDDVPDTGIQKQRSRIETATEVRWLHNAGESREAIAKQLDIHIKSVGIYLAYYEEEEEAS